MPKKYIEMIVFFPAEKNDELLKERENLKTRIQVLGSRIVEYEGYYNSGKKHLGKLQNERASLEKKLSNASKRQTVILQEKIKKIESEEKELEDALNYKNPPKLLKEKRDCLYDLRLQLEETNIALNNIPIQASP